ncbi:diguanylate cyclase [Coprothermobacter proteolyticus DSM 5265]|uniref:diguanylate cyclase n=1 Tax=Coprothermobacter proteolyticus (strain ATCC 35245 / DSM 5265 / OCM 4 / BT) TaxID=309798 RepID=B5Y6T7_COPPD|nr:diguanylate cyclase [Coprothermobacter proteolyticus]ACI17160.1 diguanylate cyclase [Coprothermobacter proteolyticus DSM 5265]
MWYDEKLSQVLGSIIRNRLGVWGQHGSGKTFLLKGLRRRLERSFYIHIHSFRMPLGELYWSILSSNWDQATRLDEKSWSTFLRYISADEVPVSLAVKPNYLVDTQAINRDILLSTLTLLEEFRIKALLLDQLDPTELDDSVKYVLRELPKEGIIIVATSTSTDVFKELGYPVVPMRDPEHEREDALQQFIEVWNDLSYSDAQKLVEMSRGNLFNAQLLKEQHAESLQQIVAMEKEKNPKLFSALAHLCAGDLWFSPLSKRIVEEIILESEYSLLDSPLIIEEEPQYRFLSPEVKDTVWQMSGLDKNHVHVWWAKELSKLNMPTYWTRIAHLFANGKEKRSEAFALLMASRKEYSYPQAAFILEKALELFPELNGAKRKLANIYYSQGKYKEALSILEQIKSPTLFDQAYKVRLYVLLGMDEEARKLGDFLLNHIENVSSFYWPGMLSDLAPYIIDTINEPRKMYDYYVRLASSHVRVPILHWGAFLNAVGVSLEYSLKYEDAVELYQESIKVLQGTPRLEIFARPVINEVAIKTILSGTKTILESKESLENLIPTLSSVGQQGFWQTLLTSLQEFMSRGTLQKYIRELEETTRVLLSSTYRHSGYMTLAEHYISVLDFNLAEWFLILASKNATLEVEELNTKILWTYLRLLEGREVEKGDIASLLSRCMEHVDEGIDTAALVSVLLMVHWNPIPTQLLGQLPSTPLGESLKMLAISPDNCSNAFRYMLRLWRRWERLSMSNLGIVIFKSVCENTDKTMLKTMADWILQEVRALDYPQLTSFWQKTYQSIAAVSQWSSLLSWHLNLQEITNVQQLAGALSYIFQSYFGHDYFAKIESGTLNLEVGDHRIAKRSQNFIEKGSVIHIRVWYSTLNDPLAPQVLDLLSYSLEELNTKLFGMQDSLTGLFNRTYGNQRLTEEWELYLRGGPQFSILFLDLDGFKQVNDSFGHEMGDKVLMEFSKLLRSSLRATDVAIRWGGDEFLVILPDTDEEEAATISRRLSNQISSCITSLGKPVTASIGASSVSEVNSVEQLVDLADQRTYLAKTRKKNHIMEQ